MRVVLLPVNDDRRIRTTLWRELVALGVDPDDSRLDNLPINQLIDNSGRHREQFIDRERAWWVENMTPEEIRAIEAGVKRYSLGGVPEFPYVSRPIDYATYCGYPDVPIEAARRLYDRGLEIATDAESRHFVLLGAIEREMKFDLALDVESQERLLQLSRELRDNRPAAEMLMERHFGSLPPSRGQEYDVMPFIIAERRIAVTYRQRNDDPTALERTINLCRAMIDRSPELIALFAELERPLPAHKGFQQLAIIMDKQRAYAEARDLCHQARSEGWQGDWDKRIGRYGDRLRRE